MLSCPFGIGGRLVSKPPFRSLVVRYLAVFLGARLSWLLHGQSDHVYNLAIFFEYIRSYILGRYKKKAPKPLNQKTKIVTPLTGRPFSI